MSTRRSFRRCTLRRWKAAIFLTLMPLTACELVAEFDRSLLPKDIGVEVDSSFPPPIPPSDDIDAGADADVTDADDPTDAADAADAADASRDARNDN